MLYARTDKQNWPMAWEKCQSMHDYLQKMGVWNIQFIMEMKMFATRDGGPFRATLVKWGEPDRSTAPQGYVQRTREVLLETSDPQQMEAALFMLINEAEVRAKEYQQVSMVP